MSLTSHGNYQNICFVNHTVLKKYLKGNKCENLCQNMYSKQFVSNPYVRLFQIGKINRSREIFKLLAWLDMMTNAVSNDFVKACYFSVMLRFV